MIITAGSFRLVLPRLFLLWILGRRDGEGKDRDREGDGEKEREGDRERWRERKRWRQREIMGEK